MRANAILGEHLSRAGFYFDDLKPTNSTAGES